MAPREIFPFDDVRACARNAQLQRRARQRHLAHPGDWEDALNDVAELNPDVRLDELEWLWFTSPEWTWDRLCGREGWLLWNPQTGDQVHFLCLGIS